MFFWIYFVGFTTNADVSTQKVFGKDMNTWLVYTLIFLGVTMLSFGWVWLSGLIHDQKGGTSIQDSLD